MANNHLIIGLGGTGGNIIRSFRKTVYQTFSSNQATGVNLRYLYVDSDDEFMKPNDPSWKTLGYSVELDQTSKMLIQGMNLRDVVDNLGQYPGLRPWLGNRQDWGEILGSANAAKVVGGQKRRLGRFLFAINASRFRERVKDFVREMQQDRSQIAARTATDIHVCCGLAGGTGSGSVIDALCQIRAAFPDPQYRILLYALLPERNPKGDRGGQNYHANGYAALVELNALQIGSWIPHNVLSTDGSRFKGIQDPFNCCYLFNDENEANVPVSLDQLYDITSSFLFQKIVQTEAIRWVNGNPVQRQEDFQVGGQGISPEKSARGAARRSRYFFSFGVKQIAYPEVEIGEYLTYSFAEQCARQLMFNRWVEGEGYVGEAVNQSFNEAVEDKANLEKWFLTDERLTLSDGIVPTEIDNKNWKPISDYWKMLVPNYATQVLDEHKGTYVKMLPELTRLAETAYSEKYRGSGVAAFYATKRKDMTDHVRELHSKIEADLFSQWRTGEKAMYDVDRFLGALIESLEKRIVTIDGRIAKLGEDSEAYKLNEDRIKGNREQWAKLGPLSVAIGKHKKLVQAQAEALITRYTLKTRLEGFRYARDLVLRLIQDLNTLSADVGRCRKTVMHASKKFSEAIASRLRDEGAGDLSNQTVREYDPKYVRGFVREMVQDRTQQRKQTSAARESLLSLLKERESFTSFANNIGEVEFSDALEKSCKVQSAAAHASAIAENPDRGKILNVSVIELLRRQFEGNQEALRAFTHTIMNMASNYLKLDRGQEQLVGPGIPAFNNRDEAVCSTTVSIIMPDVKDSPEFRDRLFTSLRNSFPGQGAIVEEAINPSRPHEITVLSVTNIFPARFVSVVSFLKEKYEARLKGANGKRAFLELHSEGDQALSAPGQTLYDLYAESYKPADILPWVLLADEMHLLTRGKNFDTGRERIRLAVMNRDGFQESLDLGANIESVVQDAAPVAVEELRNQVERALEGDYLRVEKRKELERALKARVDETGREFTYDSPRYKEQVTAFSTVRRVLEVGD